MRHLVLLAALASACDQGATAAPPAPVSPQVPQPVPQSEPPAPPRYVVRDDVDFGEKALAVLDQLGDLFADGTKDCEALATRVETFGAQNVTMFAVLTEYARVHPDVSATLQKQFAPRMNQLVQKMMPSLQDCISNPRITRAFQKLTTDAQQLQQRPR